MKLKLLWLFSGLMVRTLVYAGEVSFEPILRLETGMHVAPITGLAVDAQGRYLATSSEDGNARVWEFKSHGLLRTLRPTIAPGAGDVGSSAIDNQEQRDSLIRLMEGGLKSFRSRGMRYAT